MSKGTWRLFSLIARANRVLIAEGLRGIWLRLHNRLRSQTSRHQLTIQQSTPTSIPDLKQYQNNIYTSLSYRIPPLRFDQPISFPECQNPVISVIVVATDSVNIYRCLVALTNHPSHHKFEVIVVDDSISKQTADLLSIARGIQILRNETCLGFAKSCNYGATIAHSPYLCFLRDGVVLQSNCLDEMLATFITHDDCGIVGIKLVASVGKLREAGGILWNDGSLAHPGAGDDPDAPSYSYLRTVDFCTSAILISKSLFDQVIGFDEKFKDYAEADLALELYERGKKVYYQPLAQAVLFTQIAPLDKEINLFITKWRKQLTKKLQPGLSPSQNHRTLFIDIDTPTPDKDAGSMDAFNHMKILSSIGYQVNFIPAGSLLFKEKYTTDLQRIGVECLYSPYVRSVDEYIIQHGKDYSVIILCRAFNASKYIETVRKHCPRAKVIFSTVDLHYLREMRRAEIEKSANLMIFAQKIRNVELDVVKKVDCTLVVSDKEVGMLRAELPDANIVHLPLITSIGNREEVPFSERKDIFFVGGYQHLPNVDAVRYFIIEVWPLIHTRIPGVKFYIIGANPPEEIQNLASPNVIVLGHVDDLSGFFNGFRLSIAPIRYGAGIKGKVLHSLGYGLPVVASSIAIEGTGLIDNEQILVADTPQAFADDVVRLYNEEELWRKLSQNGLLFFKENYSFEVGRRNLVELMKSLNCRVSGPFVRSLALTEIGSFAQYKIHEEIMAAEYVRRSKIESQLIGQKESFTTPGYCYICSEKVAFCTNFIHALKDNTRNLSPNWREQMVCPKCSLNNRMRAAIQIFEQLCVPQLDDEIYLTEQTTPLYHWFRQNYSAVTGSEYLANEVPYGSLDERGIRNETLTGLTFDNGIFDSILSFDVIEHIPDYASAFKETLRCLKPGGRLIFTVPFNRNSNKHTVQARVSPNGTIEHILPPEYHGDPLNSEGVLCFYHFGWELLAQLQEIGFASATAYLYWSRELGYLGYEQILFVAQKSPR